jgi:8-oxo-dGTP pyrophosphatase MutT (NUDIX family)
MEEIVHIVDEENQPLYQTSKKEAHQKGLLHPIIIAELKDSQGNFILVKQADDRQDPGQYVSPVGGHIRATETELEALQRETLEEVSITEFDQHFIGKAVFNRSVLGRQENHLFIVYEIISDQEPKLNEESVSYKKFTAEELRAELKKHPELFGDAFLFVVEKFYPDLL